MCCANLNKPPKKALFSTCKCPSSQQNLCFSYASAQAANKGCASYMQVLKQPKRALLLICKCISSQQRLCFLCASAQAARQGIVCERRHKAPGMCRMGAHVSVPALVRLQMNLPGCVRKRACLVCVSAPAWVRGKYQRKEPGMCIPRMLWRQQRRQA